MRRRMRGPIAVCRSEGRVRIRWAVPQCLHECFVVLLVALAAGACNSPDSNAPSDSGTVDSGTEDASTPPVQSTGPFVVPIGRDTTDNGYIDTLVLDVYAAPATAGLGIRVRVDNTDDQGDPVLYVFDGAWNVLDVVENTEACSWPALVDPVTGCPALLHVPSADDSGLKIGVGIWVALRDPAEYSFATFAYDDGQVVTDIEPVLVQDDLLWPL